MRVLFLGYNHSPLLTYLRARESLVVSTMSRISGEYVSSHKIDFLVSYGYRYILKRDVLGQLTDRAINLHIALLPWNKGADPNFWSFVEKTPKGVTIHYLDEGVDTGDIIAQREVPPHRMDTFNSMYHRLHYAIQHLFIQNWDEIRVGKCVRVKQEVGAGTFHYSKDKTKFTHLLTDEWDTPIANFV